MVREVRLKVPAWFPSSQHRMPRGVGRGRLAARGHTGYGTPLSRCTCLHVGSMYMPCSDVGA